MSLYSRLDRLAADVEKLNKQVTAVSNQPQSQRISVEGGSIDFNDEDGNLMAVVGGQDDGSNTIRHVDGPTPPIPSGLSAHVDGPIIQVSWDGTFEDADNATYDWSHLEVIAVGPSNENLRGTINDVTGASTNLAATSSGEWTVVARSVSRAEKRSLDGDAGTVDVKLVDIDGAIEAVQDSANGKNKVTYSEFAPTSADPGIFDDTWFVGQVGRPNDIVEATNLARNPKFATLSEQASGGVIYPGGGAVLSVGDGFLRIAPGSGNDGAAYAIQSSVESAAAWQGKTLTVSATLRLTEPQSGSINANARRLNPGYERADGSSDYGLGLSPQAPNTVGDHRLSVTITVPADARAWFVRFRSGSTVGSTFWTDVQIEEGSTATEFFYGGTPSGESDNDPHYRWTGTPHASTSEKYLPALTIGDSDNWNIIEQYRHDGTSWVRVELSHKVFSSVDLGKATVGELDGIRIAAQTIRGEQLSGDAIDGKVITGATIQTAGSGARVQMDSGGLSVYNSSNDWQVRLTPNESTFKGDLEADSLVANGAVEFRSADNVVAQGGRFMIASGITDPTAPPLVQPFWDSTPVPVVQVTPLLKGLAWDGESYWTARRTGAWIIEGDPTRHRIMKMNPATMVYEIFPVPTDRHPGAIEGVTCIGSELFILMLGSPTDGVWSSYVVVTDLDVNFKREFPYVDIGYSPTNPLTYKPGIGNDGTNIVIAHSNDAGVLNIRTYNKTTGTQIGSTVSGPDDAYKSDTSGVYVGPADDGANRIYVRPDRVQRVSAYTASGVYDDTRRFDTATPGSTGVVFHDGKFHTLDPSGAIHEYADANTGDGGSDWWAAYAWNTDPSYSSRISPGRRFTWPRRSKIKLLGQPLPDGAASIAPALAKGTTTPTRTDYHMPPWANRVGESVAWFDALPLNWNTYASPPSVSNYPNATPASFVSASNTFQVNGDGSGRWGPLTFNSDGTMTQTAPAWTAITSFASGFSAHTFGYAPAYRVWPDGKVEWRGVIGGTFNATGGVDPFTLPPATRPAQSVNFQIATQGNAGGRAEFGPTGATTVLRIYTSSSRPFAMLDGCYYYTT